MRLSNVLIAIAATAGVAVFLGFAAEARANPFEKLSDDELSPYHSQLGAEAPYRAGERLLADLEARDKVAAAALVDAAIVRFHADEARRFGNDRQAVLYAYGVIWVVVTGFVLFLWLRQRRVNAELTALSARISRAEQR